MSPYWEREQAVLYVGHVLDVLSELPESSVHCCITSPPYWGLRDYKIAPVVWGGESSCQHAWAAMERGRRKDVLPAECSSAGRLAHTGGDRSEESRGSALQNGGRFCTLCGAWLGCLGMEPTIEMYVEHMVEVFRAVRRVLRPDGTLWMNLGDSYAGSGGGHTNGVTPGLSNSKNRGSAGEHAILREVRGTKPGDLCAIPWRVALALQADGWYLRSGIVWAKGVSFCEGHSGSVMPESLGGWRWERCRRKVRGSKRSDPEHVHAKAYDREQGARNGSEFASRAEWEDCPGCVKCERTGGYVLRRGSWRPTSAHEMVFLLTPTSDYYCDAEAVREAGVWPLGTRAAKGSGSREGNRREAEHAVYSGERNPRNVWAIGTRPFAGAHFATYPPELIEPMVRAGTSEAGCCPECGAPWVAVVSKAYDNWSGGNSNGRVKGTDGAPDECRRFDERCNAFTRRLGFRPSCDCQADRWSGHVAGAMCALPRVRSRRRRDRQDAADTWERRAWRYAEGLVCLAQIRDGFGHSMGIWHMPKERCTVLDPFSGSGTTGMVAIQEGRRYVGIDASEEYTRTLAVPRLEQAIRRPRQLRLAL